MYKQRTPYTCGPSAYMEGFSKSKSYVKELHLHELGRIRPSKIFLGISFLELNPKLRLYTTDKLPQITTKLVKLIFVFENFNKTHTLATLKKELIQCYGRLLKKHSRRIVTIKRKNEIIKLLDDAIDKGQNVLLLTHSGYWLNHEGTLHWVVVKRKKNGLYICGDPHLGKDLSFSEKDIRKQLDLVKKVHSPLQLVR